MSAQVHIWPKEIGAGVNERGNVEIVGMDRDTGTIVKLEIHSAQWKHVMVQLGRLKGVGIIKPGASQLEVVTDEGIENGHT
ncbi:MAG: hypothetical protein ACHQ1H_01270 [Nitrososphaerales archaeon]